MNLRCGPRELLWLLLLCGGWVASSGQPARPQPPEPILLAFLIDTACPVSGELFRSTCDLPYDTFMHLPHGSARIMVFTSSSSHHRLVEPTSDAFQLLQGLEPLQMHYEDELKLVPAVHETLSALEMKTASKRILAVVTTRLPQVKNTDFGAITKRCRDKNISIRFVNPLSTTPSNPYELPEGPGLPSQIAKLAEESLPVPVEPNRALQTHRPPQPSAFTLRDGAVGVAAILLLGLLFLPLFARRRLRPPVTPRPSPQRALPPYVPPKVPSPPRVAPPPAPRATLKLVSGPGAGNVFNLYPHVVTLIGTAAEAHIPLPAEEPNKIHCRIEATKRGFRLHALDKGIPIFLNDRTCSDCYLTHKSRLSIGAACFQYRKLAAPPGAVHAPRPPSPARWPPRLA